MLSSVGISKDFSRKMQRIPTKRAKRKKMKQEGLNFFSWCTSFTKVGILPKIRPMKIDFVWIGNSYRQ